MMLLPVLAGFAFGLSAPQQHETNYQIVVQHTDPNNGYIDYVRATDLVQGLELEMCLQWTPTQYDDLAARKKGVESHPNDHSRSWSANDEARLTIAERLHEMDYLGVQRLAASKFGGAMTLIRAGNLKKAWDPRDTTDVNTRFPELRDFRKIASLIRADAYVRFADGDTKGGTGDLLEGLTFCRHIGGMNILSELIQSAAEAIILSAFEEHLPQLSDKDAIQIVRYMDVALAETATYLQALQRERDELLRSVDTLLANPDIMLSHPKPLPEEIAVVKYLKGVSSGERDTVKSGITKDLGAAYDRIIAQIGPDESSWADKSAEDMPPSPPTITNSRDATDALVHILMPASDRITVAVLKTRAQLRLLDLHARIIDYKWQTNHLPTELKDAAPQQLIFDPLAKTVFQYELKDPGYRLYSKGVPSTGPIELRYRRPANLPGDPNDPIPPVITK